MKDKFYDILWWIAIKLEDIAEKLKYAAIWYWSDFCEYCGMEGGYGHKAGCPKLKKANPPPS